MKKFTLFLLAWLCQYSTTYAQQDQSLEEQLQFMMSDIDVSDIQQSMDIFLDSLPY